MSLLATPLFGAFMAFVVAPSILWCAAYLQDPIRIKKKAIDQHFRLAKAEIDATVSKYRRHGP
ncbi:hypothetical protein AR689_07705 [Arthrobacter sp. EpRS71]|nr:hypothetical protein AR689_07705 [Arthrobacter sp. EpRS71]